MSTNFENKEKPEVQLVEKSSDVADVKVITGSETFAAAMLKEAPSVFHPRSLLLIGCTLLGFFCQTMNGFDGSLFNGLTANDNFLNHFHGILHSLRLLEPH